MSATLEVESTDNLLLKEPEYQVAESRRGTWHRFMYSDGRVFAEYRSHAQLGSWPLVHITWGVSPESGRRVQAKGVIAIGRFAHGVIAIGQVAVGLVAIGQLAIGVLLGIGQASTGLIGIGQATLGAFYGLGQFVASGYVGIGQVVYAEYALAQIGFGEHVFDTRGVDADARDFFARMIGL